MRIIIFVLIFSLCGLFLFAGSWNKTIKPKLIDQENIPEIDGFLKEEVWQTVPADYIARDFLQFEPHKGKTANYKTEVKVLFTRELIIFGITCFDPNPDQITARLSKRDSDLMDDDAIGIEIDTYDDNRSAYYFFTNSLGIQADGRLTDNGRTSDSTWDEKWMSAARVCEFGWSAEIAIPLSILKYKPGIEQKWGIGFIRSIPRNMEIDTWTGPMDNIDKVSQFGDLTGLILKKSSFRFKIIPHIIAQFQKHSDPKISLGMDARYAISQSLSSNITVNPDFATIEADQERINLTRFELSLSEKRNFFQEGSEIYKQRIRLFYSRRISDIYGGIKLYGKSGGYEYAAMSVQSKGNDEVDLDFANYSIFRLRINIFKSSTIGFLGANRLMNGKNSGNVGLDLVHFFSDRFNLTGQLAVSYGKYSSENIAFFLRPSFDSSTFHVHLRYTQLGENFADNANSVGFIRDDDRQELDSAISKTWWIQKYGFDRIEYSSNYNIYWSKKSILRSWDIDQELEVDFSNKFSFEFDYSADYKLYEKDFYNHKFAFSLGYNTREWQSVSVKYEFGKNFGLDYKLLGAEFNYKLLKTLSLEYELSRLLLPSDPEKESTWVHVLRLTSYFTKDLYLKLFYQTNTAISKYNVQVLFEYRYKPPFGTIQLAYQKGTARLGEAGQQGHTVFVKLSYIL
jgi:hypothetical protein